MIPGDNDWTNGQAQQNHHDGYFYPSDNMRHSYTTEERQTPPTVTPPPQKSFMDGLLSPILSCVQPQLQACMAPECGGGYTSRRPPDSRRTHYVDHHHPRTSARASSSKPVVRSTPHINDVLCGRGQNHNSHPGNKNFRDLVAINKKEYATKTKKEKMQMASQIVRLILLQTDPPGRFLARDTATGNFHDIGLPRSLEKTSQALRDCTPAEREEQQKQLLLTSPPNSARRPPKPVRIQVPEHLKRVYGHAPKPQDILQYPHLVEHAVKSPRHHYNMAPPYQQTPPPSYTRPFPATAPQRGPYSVTPSPQQPHPVVPPVQTKDSSAPMKHTSNKKEKAPSPIPGYNRHNAAWSPQQEREMPSSPPRQTWVSREEPSSPLGPERPRTNNISVQHLDDELVGILPPLPKVTHNLDVSADSMDGLVALSTTAFLRLDDDE